jgi:hypothetical protein
MSVLDDAVDAVTRATRATPWRVSAAPTGAVFIRDKHDLPVVMGSVQTGDAPALSLAHEAFDLLASSPRAHEKTCAARLDEEDACDCWQKRRDDLLNLMRSGGRR